MMTRVHNCTAPGFHLNIIPFYHLRTYCKCSLTLDNCAAGKVQGNCLIQSQAKRLQAERSSHFASLFTSTVRTWPKLPFWTLKYALCKTFVGWVNYMSSRC